MRALSRCAAAATRLPPTGVRLAVVGRAPSRLALRPRYLSSAPENDHSADSEPVGLASSPDATPEAAVVNPTAATVALAEAVEGGAASSSASGSLGVIPGTLSTSTKHRVNMMRAIKERQYEKVRGYALTPNAKPYALSLSRHQGATV